MGKTTLAVNMAEYAAVHQGTKASVAIFSMEMPSEQVITRMLSSIGGVPLGNLRSGRISDEDWVRITSATTQLSEAKIFVDETPALTPTELRARARRVKREHGLNLVVVDYLQLMQVPGTKENRATEIAEISRGLKVLAKELAVPVIALSQLNRAVEQREHKKPVMSDLRECVAGDTLVWLTDGRQVPIASLVGTQPEVWAVDEQQRLVAARSDMVWKVGKRPVAGIRLASGRSIRVTAKHRVLSGKGWVRAAELRMGDHLFSAPNLERFATSDLLWSPVANIVPEVHEEDVYDMTVPGPSSWLSDGIVSHNSGAIEQDADMILLIYREEVYNKDTPKKGMAEIDLVKHRNGEIGTFLLTFQGQYTRFANYAPDAYAEGVLR
jgi:replicative DNA helicase